MKERLLGAAILVGLLVVLVPEMLSGPKDSEVAPPGAADGPLRTYTIDLTRPGAPAGQAESAAPAPINILDPAAHDPKPVAAEESASVSVQTDKPAAQTPPPPASARPDASPSSATDKPAPRSSNVGAPAPAPSRSTGKPASGGWAVQIGSFAKSDNARRLTDQLLTAGHDAFIVSTGSGAAARHKVRVGPQSTRAEADRVAAALKKQGHPVAVVGNLP